MFSPEHLLDFNRVSIHKGLAFSPLWMTTKDAVWRSLQLPVVPLLNIFSKSQKEIQQQWLTSLLLLILYYVWIYCSRLRSFHACTNLSVCPTSLQITAQLFSDSETWKPRQQNAYIMICSSLPCGEVNQHPTVMITPPFQNQLVIRSSSARMLSCTAFA